MATNNEIQAILGKAIAEPEFRASLIEDPEATISGMGYELTDEQIAQLRSTDKEELRSMLTDLDERLSKTVPAAVVSVVVSVGWP